MGRTQRLWSIAAMVCAAGCGFRAGDPGQVADAPPPEIDAAPDGPPPIACGDLTCDGHATCVENPARCECSAGYTGDGMTCADVDECATGNGGCPAACGNTAGGFACYTPVTCNDLAAHIPGFTGGVRKLYFQGMATKPWTVTCVGAAASWKEYLSLTGLNDSQYTKTGGGNTPVKTTFTKVRIIPATAKIDIADQTFSTSTGSLIHSGGTQVTSMPYAVAMDCVGNNSNTGVAHIDLSGTQFVITDMFEMGGAQPDGTVNSMNGGRQVTTTGGGNCGWLAPAPAPFNPFNQITNGDILDIAYAP
jgi:hypothetical protein